MKTFNARSSICLHNSPSILVDFCVLRVAFVQFSVVSGVQVRLASCAWTTERSRSSRVSMSWTESRQLRKPWLLSTSHKRRLIKTFDATVEAEISIWIRQPRVRFWMKTDSTWGQVRFFFWSIIALAVICRELSNWALGKNCHRVTFHRRYCGRFWICF